MYLPSAFRVDEVDELAAFMAAHGFATVITAKSQEDVAACHVPLLVSRQAQTITLAGHVARANAQWKHFDGRTDALIIFQGPHAYVSPTLYSSHPAVPTWNYTVVHARGKPRLLDGAEKTALICKQVDEYERHRSPRWRMEDTPQDFQARLLEAIVAFEMPVERLEGKFKLSQNRSAEDQLGVIAGLETQGGEAAALAAMMRARKG